MNLHFCVVKKPKNLGVALNTERLLSARLRYMSDQAVLLPK